MFAIFVSVRRHADSRVLSLLQYGQATNLKQGLPPSKSFNTQNLRQPLRSLIIELWQGSGKTLAFGLPILQSLLDRKAAVGAKEVEEGKKLRALVLAPTRELALQARAPRIILTLYLLESGLKSAYVLPYCRSSSSDLAI